MIYMLYYAPIYNKSYKDALVFCEMFKKIKGRINVSSKIIKGVKNWPRVFLNYFNPSSKGYILFNFRSGEKVKISNVQNEGDTSGIATIFEIFLMETYCPKGMEIKDSDIVIDIGANMGVFSIYAALKAKHGKVYSYEPFKPHFKRLLLNIKLNNLKNIFTFEIGVSGKSGKKDLFISDLSSGMHSLIPNKNSKNKTSIECTTLENIFKENKIKKCDFLKMDCEKAEYDILYSTPKNIFKKIKKISLEFDNIDDKKNCFKLKELLESNGFEVKINGAHQHQGILYARKN